jgi:hypothetical protein
MTSASLAGLRPSLADCGPPNGCLRDRRKHSAKIDRLASPPDPRRIPVARDVFSTVACDQPRLMATKSAIARTKQLVRHDTTAQEWQKKIAERADLMLGLPPLTPTWKRDPRKTGALFCHWSSRPHP